MSSPARRGKVVQAGTVVLALNCGSSSLKFGLYRVTSSRTEMLLDGEAEAFGDGSGKFFFAQDAHGKLRVSERLATAGPREAIVRIERLLAQSGLPPPASIGHRIVHGGPALDHHALIDDRVMSQLEAATDFAPLHAPAALAVVRLAQEHFPGLAQVACFDTAFHAGLPDVARVLALPRALEAEGIHRYGFHGLSCESIVRRVANDPPHPMPDRLVIAHLGSGASITAVKAGRSIDTSMGLTPSGGVMMGTRSGDLDPGVLIHLMREHKLDAAMLEDLVDRRSGLLGVSGVGSDMRRLHDAALTNVDAQLAIHMFCYAVRKQVAAMIAALDGVDMFVFTGGIGENDAEVRAEICDGLSWIGVGLDAERNLDASNPIENAASRCAVRVIASNEDEQIARHTCDIASRRAA